MHNAVKHNAQNCEKIESLKHCRTLPPNTKPCMYSTCVNNNTNTTKPTINNNNVGSLFTDSTKSNHCTKNTASISVCSVVGGENKVKTLILTMKLLIELIIGILNFFF